MTELQKKSFIDFIDLALAMQKNGASRQNVYMFVDFKMKSNFFIDIEMRDLVKAYKPAGTLFRWLVGDELFEKAMTE